MFRYRSWESSEVQSQLALKGWEKAVPVAGLFSEGAVCEMNGLEGGEGGVAVMDTDSVYAVITKLPVSKPASSSSTASSTVTASAITSSTPHPSHSTLPPSPPSSLLPADILPNPSLYSDILDGVIVAKRDPESSSATRVAGMDYVVPDKVPQPRNTLESLVWDREKDIDRMRERFQMSRALIQAKVSTYIHRYIHRFT